MKLSQLHPNEGQIAGVPKNPRYITEKDFKALKKSLTGFRKMLALRPIVIDEDFNILGGNMRYRALVKLAEEHAKVGAFEFTDEIPDEWIKQDCTLTEKEKREFVLKDNKERGEWDMDALANEWDTPELKKWDIDVVVFDDEQENYSRKIEPPIYEPSMKMQPELSECFDVGKYKSLIDEIDGSNTPEDVKQFLRFAATRHIVFDYQMIAEYYAQANSNIQELMEKSALVIIDMDSAIEGGFVKMTKQLEELIKD